MYNYYQNDSMNLYSPKEGYDKGNMFANLYSEYKDYKPRVLEGNTEQEKMFLELSRYAFALHDIKLFLDVNSNDNSMIELYNDYNKRLNSLINEYNEKYGMEANWPWEGVMY